MTDSRAPELHVDFFGQCHNATCGDVLTWQTEMVWRGWEIDTDGVYGPESEEACRGLQDSKSLEVDGLVGPDTWSITWDTPVNATEIRAMRKAARAS